MSESLRTCFESYLRMVLQFGMPIFFYFSGRSATFSKDGALQWIWKKFLRLMVPCIFGTLVIVIPTAYIGRMYRPQTNKQVDISFWSFYARYFPDEFTSNGFEVTFTFYTGGREIRIGQARLTKRKNSQGAGRRASNAPAEIETPSLFG